MNTDRRSHHLEAKETVEGSEKKDNAGRKDRRTSTTSQISNIRNRN